MQHNKVLFVKGEYAKISMSGKTGANPVRARRRETRYKC